MNVGLDYTLSNDACATMIGRAQVGFNPRYWLVTRNAVRCWQHVIQMWQLKISDQKKYVPQQVPKPSI